MTTPFAIYCVPVNDRDRDGKREEEHIRTLAKGFPIDGSEGEKFVWSALAYCGAAGYSREPHYYDFKRRLQLYATKQLADAAAAKMQAKNNCWRFIVQPVRIQAE